ncbi:hypothetical protein H0H92_008945, partial [Tricholoma furcatifolium]
MALNERRKLEQDPKKSLTSSALTKQRENLRKALKEAGVVSRKNSFEPLSSWINDLLGKENTSEAFAATSQLQMLYAEVHHCTGSGAHTEITKAPQRLATLSIGLSSFKAYDGNFQDYCNNVFSVKPYPIQRRTCWRVQAGEVFCTGTRTDFEKLVVSIPLILRVEIQDESLSHAEIERQSWNFPQTLAVDNTTSYSLIGLGLINDAANHFIARYTFDGSIYTYDGMAHNGMAILEPEATLSSHLAGAAPSLPNNFRIHQVFYSLNGGLEMQHSFFTQRIAALGAEHSLEFSETIASGCRTLQRITKEYVYKGAKLPQPMPIHPDSPESEEETYRAKPITIDNGLDLDAKLDTSFHSAMHNLSSPKSVASSLPDSLFSLNCRCGLVADGNIFYQADEY